MPEWLELLVALGAWVAIQTWLLPRLGFSTWTLEVDRVLAS
jgi:hypothetical protein